MSPFVTQLPPHLIEKLHADLLQQGFTLHTPPHTLFSGKKKGISCTLYQSGKLVVQGKAMKDFIEFYLEPELLQDFSSTLPQKEAHVPPHIGVDESGKGDFFGPLCVAAVYADTSSLSLFAKWGLCDSKKIADAKIRKLATQIRQESPHALLAISPRRYNELYESFRNLNHLLGWGHATVIGDLIEKTGCQEVLVDQFADEKVVERALLKKGVEAHLTQRPRAEEDVVVAAASILSRDAFLRGMDRMKEDFGMTFPKGASAQVVKAGKDFVSRYGRESLPLVAKMHFKTAASLYT